MKNKLKSILLLPLILLSGCTINDLWGGGDASQLTLKSIQTLLSNAINLLTGVAGIIAFIFIIIGGYQYMTSIGNEEQANKAKQTLLYAFIGLIIILGAYAIIRFIMMKTLKSDFLPII